MGNLMKNVQIRIGKLFTIFSLAVFFIKLFYHIRNEDSLDTFFVIYNTFYLIYFLLFGVTCIWLNTCSKILQSILIFVAAILSITPNNSSTPIFGLLMIIFVILLAYVYGFYNADRIPKIIASIIIIYLVFIFFPLRNYKERFFLSAQWLLFIAIFILALYSLFKDFIDRAEEKELKDRDKLIRILEETRDIARDALTAYEKYFNNKKE